NNLPAAAKDDSKIPRRAELDATAANGETSQPHPTTCRSHGRFGAKGTLEVPAHAMWRRWRMSDRLLRERPQVRVRADHLECVHIRLVRTRYSAEATSGP